MDRRKFFEKSLLATGGLLLAPIYISCTNDDDSLPIVPTDLRRTNFLEGVASFDPTASRVIIWTRYTVEAKESPLEGIVLNWQVATDAAFDNIVRNGTALATAEHDYTVAVDVQELDSNSTWYYRFFNIASNTVSVIGETITLPAAADNVADVKLAVCSCANYAAGLFNVYDAMANSDADVIVHLGDYIYEYGEGEYGTNENTVALGRVHKPKNEIVSLQEYRERYKQYRSDKQLQLAHQKKPFICVWDDHEITNDAYSEGAENHQSDEGSYEARKKTAIQVYSEFLPIRSSDPAKIYRSFNFGSMLSLHMLDTRIIGRDRQLSYNDFFNFSTGELDSEAFQAALLDSGRTLLGAEQLNWLSGVISSSTTTWQVLGQQVLMGKMFIPSEVLIILGQVVAEVSATGSVSAETAFAFQNSLSQLTAIKTRLIAGDESLTTEEITRIRTVLPYNLDAWDGYFAEREQIFTALADKKMVCLAGDTHNAWHSILRNLQGNEIGVEFATSSVTSPGFENFAGLQDDQIPGFEAALATLIDELQYTDASRRGYLKVTFTKGNATAQWSFIDTIAQNNYLETVGHTFSYS
ncbi:alkaline phosphatase D family protein [Aquimarina sp. U1-2]|uniref:alkaline phosphatase D family protein n=1 Tax=Aquimarina sp. U1-2 TaxID=2823141 RepID=UPI001AED0ECE|nr:alkaline phosphatase D family protein [Aquimarina sp. U1-2]MBP2831546.1 alkaline phosphatase D family protein [Aquimarina sp. U1-2]